MYKISNSDKDGITKVLRQLSDAVKGTNDIRLMNAVRIASKLINKLNRAKKDE